MKILHKGSSSSVRAALLVALAVGLPTIWAVPVTITSGNTPQTDENILFNEAGLVAGPATLVEGISNNTGFIVNFSSDEDLVTPSAGQARVEGDDGGLDNLAIALAQPGATFQTLILNLNAVADGNVTFTVTYIDAAGSPHVQVFTIDGSGQNFFTIVAGDGAKLTEVAFSTDVDLEDVRQIRIGGIAGTAVPDGGATAVLLGLGFLGAAGLRRKS